MAKDLYEVLEIKKDATDGEIKSAYRKAALKWHPDKHKGDKDAEEKFKEINNAYEVLSDKQKRQQYDTFGSAGGPGGFGGGGQGFGGFGGGGQGFGGFDFSGGSSGFADIFESFFTGGAQGGGRSGQRKRTNVRGSDIETNIKITFEEAVFGVEKELEITKADKCEHCDGKGSEPGTKIVECKDCNGRGEVKSVRNTILGQIATTRVCDTCEGEGKIPEKKCGVCHGTTRVRKTERVKVKIPAGVDHGSTIRLSGKGEAGIKGGAYGDLYLVLLVSENKKFERSGLNIHSKLKIHLVQAVLGDEIEVETIHGMKKIKIPAGTEDGKVFKLSGSGIEAIGGGKKGDHLVKVKLEIPKKLSKREKELYSEIAKESNLNLKKGGLFS